MSDWHYVLFLKCFCSFQKYCENHDANVININGAKENSFIKGYLSELKGNP